MRSTTKYGGATPEQKQTAMDLLKSKTVQAVADELGLTKGQIMHIKVSFREAVNDESDYFNVEQYFQKYFI